MTIDVKAAVEKTGLTQKELAVKMGCSFQWLTNIQKEELCPENFRRILKLSEISKIPINKLIKK